MSGADCVRRGIDVVISDLKLLALPPLFSLECLTRNVLLSFPLFRLMEYLDDSLVLPSSTYLGQLDGQPIEMGPILQLDPGVKSNAMPSALVAT
eukprot:2579535-Amphidinium_carterae.1